MFTVFVLPYPIPEMIMPADAQVVYKGDSVALAFDAQAAALKAGLYPMIRPQNEEAQHEIGREFMDRAAALKEAYVY
jgi:hypothetical protein